jgi:integrase/recombinase XerD
MEERVEDFLVTLAAGKCSPHTVMAYRNDLMQLVAHLRGEGVTAWDEIAAVQVMAYLQSLRERQYASSTIARKTAASKSFFLHLRQTGQIGTDIAASLAAPRVDRYTPHAITTDEVTRLLAAPMRMKTPEGTRDAAMLQLLYATGMRVSELVALNVEDFHIDQNYIHCEGRGARMRQINLTPPALDAMTRYLAQGRPILARAHGADHEALFLNHRGQRLTRQGFWLILKGYAQSAAVHDVTPHTLRHTFAAHALITGHHLRDVQSMLGHVSISTTQVYQRLRPTPPAPVATRASLSVVKLLGGGTTAAPLSSAVVANSAAAIAPASGDIADGGED